VYLRNSTRHRGDAFVEDRDYLLSSQRRVIRPCTCTEHSGSKSCGPSFSSVKQGNSDKPRLSLTLWNWIIPHDRTSSSPPPRAWDSPDPGLVTKSLHNPNPPRYNISINTVNSQNNNIIATYSIPPAAGIVLLSFLPALAIASACITAMILWSPMIGRKSSLGCRLSNPTYGTTTFEKNGLRRWETGFCAQKNSLAGRTVMARVNRKRQPYFARAT